MFRLVAVIVLLAAPKPAYAWWDYGHRVIAAIAMREVAPATRAAIERLLAEERLLETPTCPAATLQDAAVWPDCIKPLGDRYAYAFAWHYQNVDVCKPFDMKSACANGNCVSSQIDRSARMLADTALPVRVRVEALAFLAHFVGDLHMPLHAGDRGDLGGNAVKTAYGLIAGRTNLHLMWDGYLAERAITTPPTGPEGLIQALGAAEKSAMAAGTTEDWAREAWTLSRELAYGKLPDGPCGPAPTQRPVLDEATTQSLLPDVRRQIARAGLRLARMLDTAFQN